MGKIEEDDEIFEDDGDENWENKKWKISKLILSVFFLPYWTFYLFYLSNFYYY